MKLSTTLLCVALVLNVFLAAQVGWADAERATSMHEEIVGYKEQASKALGAFMQRCDMDNEVNENWEPVVKELLPSLSNDDIAEIVASMRRWTTMSAELCRKLRDASGGADAQSASPMEEETVDSKEQKLKELEDSIQACDKMVYEEVNEDWEPVVKELLPSLSNDAVAEVAASFRQVETASVELCRKLRGE